MNAMTRSDRETEIEEWLEDHTIDDAWSFAPAIVGIGIDISRLEEVAILFLRASRPVPTELLPYANPTRFAEITDGLSNTVCISETVMPARAMAPAQRWTGHQTPSDANSALKYRE